MRNVIVIILLTFRVIFVQSQVVEVQGQLKVTQVNQNSEGTDVLIRNLDGTIGKNNITNLSGAINQVVLSTTFYNPGLNKLGYILVGSDNQSLSYSPIDSSSWRDFSSFSGFSQRSFAAIDNNGHNAFYIFGGENVSLENTGIRYQASPAQIQPMTTTGAPSPRREPFAFVNKLKPIYEHGDLLPATEKLIIYGGNDNSGSLSDGAIYQYPSNVWTPMSSNNAPFTTVLLTAVWTGEAMFTFRYNQLKKFDLELNTWTDMAVPPQIRLGQTMIFTGTDILIWGGNDENGIFQTSLLKYNIQSNSWVVINDANAPSGRSNHSAEWTGNEMIVWGGWDQTNYLNDGKKFNPVTNDWSNMASAQSLAGRLGFICEWDGRDLYIYGGSNTTSGLLNDGARYNPVLDKWESLTIINRPQPMIGFCSTLVNFNNLNAPNGFGKSPALFFFGGQINGNIVTNNKVLFGNSENWFAGWGSFNDRPLYIFAKVK